MVFVYTAMGVLCVEHANVLKLCYIELLSGDGSFRLFSLVPCRKIPVADLRGARGTRAPPGVQILSISCSFWEILAKSYVGAPPGSWRPPRGNPGSATAYGNTLWVYLWEIF